MICYNQQKIKYMHPTPWITRCILTEAQWLHAAGLWSGSEQARTDQSSALLMYCSESELDWWWWHHLKTTGCAEADTLTESFTHSLEVSAYKNICQICSRSTNQDSKSSLVILFWNPDSTHWWWELPGRAVLDGWSRTQTVCVILSACNPPRPKGARRHSAL